MKFSFVSFFLSSFLFVSCGVKEPETKLPKDLNELLYPEYSLKHSSLNLDSLETEVLNMSGALTLWKKQADGDIGPFRKVIAYSKKMKEAMGGIAKSDLEKARLEGEVEELEKKASQARGTQVQFFYSSLKEDEILSQHKSLFQEASISDEDFELFCDSQFVDFSRTKFLQEEKYNRRPMPYALCESYYEKQGYFSHSSCRSNPRGKNYLECFWSTDFFEKSHFKLMRKVEGELVEISSEEINSDAFQDSWHQEDWPSVLSSTERYLKLSILKREMGEKLYFYFDHEKKKMGEHLVLPFNSELKALYKRNKGIEGGAKYSFADLLFNSSQLSNEEQKLLAYSVREDDEQELAELTSEDPRLFQATYETFAHSNPEEAGDLERKREEFDREGALLEEQSTLANEKLSETKRLFDGLFVAKKDNGEEYDLAHSMWSNMKISLQKNEEGLTQLSWTLHDDFLIPEGGSYDEAIIPPTFTCLVKKEGSEDREGEEGLTHCRYNRNTGKLKFSLSQEAMRDMGWMLLPKNGNGQAFNSISPNQLEGASLSFNLDYILYQNLMPMFTGEATLSTQSKDYWGTVLVKSF